MAVASRFSGPLDGQGPGPVPAAGRVHAGRDPDSESIHLLKNLSMLGGLLITAAPESR